jgi:hypothetical protein
MNCLFSKQKKKIHTNLGPMNFTRVDSHICIVFVAMADIFGIFPRRIIFLWFYFILIFAFTNEGLGC